MQLDSALHDVDCMPSDSERFRTQVVSLVSMSFCDLVKTTLLIHYMSHTAQRIAAFKDCLISIWLIHH